MAKKLEVKYIKSYDFSSKLATGVYGGLTGQGKLCMNFYIDRPPLPDVGKLTPQADGNFKEEYEGNDFLSVREVNSCVVMDIEMAKEFHGWLSNKLVEFEKVQKELEKNANLNKKAKQS